MYKMLEDNMNNFDKYNDNFGNEKYLIQICSQAKRWYKTPRSSWGTKRVRSKLKTRKATYHSQTR